jgi:iron-sulfur cluster assembly protein
MSVSLTDAAARHVTRYLTKRGKGVGVRLGVKTTGCSGLAYKLEYVDEIAPEDTVFEDHGVKVLIDPKSLAYIDGTELDFVDGLSPLSQALIQTGITPPSAYANLPSGSFIVI